MWTAEDIAELVRQGFHFDPKLREQFAVETDGSGGVMIEAKCPIVAPTGLMKTGEVIRFVVVPSEVKP